MSTLQDDLVHAVHQVLRANPHAPMRELTVAVEKLQAAEMHAGGLTSLVESLEAQVAAQAETLSGADEHVDQLERQVRKLSLQLRVARDQLIEAEEDGQDARRQVEHAHRRAERAEAEVAQLRQGCQHEMATDLQSASRLMAAGVPASLYAPRYRA